MTFMLLSGAGNTIFLKLQIESRDNEGRKFKHPYFGAINVFGAGSIAFIIYLIYKCFMIKSHGSVQKSPDCQRAVRMGKKPTISAFWVAIPSCFDFMAIPLMNLGLIMVSASIYQMLRGGLILVTAISSIIFLKARLHRHHWTSLVFIVGGVVIVGISSIRNSEDESSSIYGMLLIFLSQLLSAAHWIIEEKILMTHYIHPFRMVGIEGIVALILSIIMVVILYFIHCSGQYCPNGRAEDAVMAFEQMGQNYMIIVYMALLTISV
jgi:drug/metabolite transporter (DMT)-like permease